MSRLLHRVRERMFDWFDSKNAAVARHRLPACFGPRARLALVGLEDRVVPANIVVHSTQDFGSDTLRDAITAANATPTVADTITFDPLVFSGTQTIYLDSALPTIASPMTITGPGSGLLTLSKLSNPNPFSMFTISDGSTTSVIAVGISGIKVNGNGASAISIANENVTLSDLQISGASFTGSGGGIAIAGGTLVVSGSNVSGNTVTGTGGGIAAAGATANVTILNSLIANNSAIRGGGLALSATGGNSLAVIGSTISGNVAFENNPNATYGGGGILVNGSVGAAGVQIRNSTISSNISYSGGGITFRSLSGTASIQNSTLFNNQAFLASGSAPGLGGGGISVTSVGTTALLDIESSIVSGNHSNITREDIATVFSGLVFPFEHLGRRRSGSGCRLHHSHRNRQPPARAVDSHGPGAR